MKKHLLILDHFQSCQKYLYGLLKKNFCSRLVRKIGNDKNLKTSSFVTSVTSTNQAGWTGESEVTRGVLANQTAYNVSKLLDSLLQDYDNSLRPDFAGENQQQEGRLQSQALFCPVHVSKNV